MNTLTHFYDWPLILLSISVAIFSSFIALDISSRLALSTAKSRHRWIGAGAIVLGLGIWSMHFMAMLAFHLPTEVSYEVPLVIISILPALIASGIAFSIIHRPSYSLVRFLVGALFIAAGIVSMHYIGMEAMNMSLRIVYDPFLVALSVLVAYTASLAALFLLFRSQHQAGFHWRKLGSAVILGAAISGMHYTGMAAATYVSDSHAMHPHVPSVTNSLLGYAVAFGMLVILGFTYLNLRYERRIFAQKRASNDKFESVIESAKEAIIVTTDEGLITHWNRGAETIFGYAKKEMIGKHSSLLIPAESGEQFDQIRRQYLPHAPGSLYGKTHELTGLRKDGSVFPMEMSLGSWQEGETFYFSKFIRDITTRKQSEDQIRHLSLTDSLTDLPNRRYFTERLLPTLQNAKANQESLALLYMDIDHFKHINDRFGHPVGDQLLVEVTERLRLKIGKVATLARLGGDEFVFLLPGADSDKAIKFAANILKCFHTPFLLEKENLYVTPSIGISVYPDHGDDVDTLIKHADIALYQVKEFGKNHFRLFTNDMREVVSRQSRIANDLHRALENQEFSIYYQPQVSLASGRIVGVEALLRWNHPQLGMISPGEFIPIAETTGSILQIGKYVLQAACEQNKAWQETGLPELRVAVNISALQFSQPNFYEEVEKVLHSTRLAPHLLEFVLTERLLQESKGAIETMNDLKRLGVHLSIDDFGTGFSSLRYLRLLPVCTLKIDQHFTGAIGSDPKDASLVKTIIQLAHDLGMSVTAEGVETQQQEEFLRHHLCDYAQGYYFSKPVPPKEITQLFSKQLEY
ncbi:EAL domain-containing protein [Chryseomicrobium palamuruense]|uniref:EAL domain-containing protein n=2 Tax=Chryseomicrobium palamuruense TaxID=682973 RepID=A0ABV8UX18_9BACL